MMGKSLSVNSGAGYFEETNAKFQTWLRNSFDRWFVTINFDFQLKLGLRYCTRQDFEYFAIELVNLIALRLTLMYFNSLECRPYSKSDIADDNIVKYLGFCDLRPRVSTMGNPIALGILTPPSRFDNDNYRIITGNYATPFGGIPDECGSHLLTYLDSNYDPKVSLLPYTRIQTPKLDQFSFFVANDKGTRCSQACIIMLSGLLSDRKGKIISSIDASAFKAIRDTGDEQTEKEFDCSPTQMKSVLEEYCNVNACSIAFPHENNHRLAEYQAERVIEAFIHARCPVVLFVSEETLNVESPVEDKYSQDFITDAHAIVVAGIEQSPSSNIIFDTIDDRRVSKGDVQLPQVDDAMIKKFIIHDPARGPFVQHDRKKCFEACWKYDAKNKDRLNFLVALPKNIDLLSFEQIYKLLPDNMKDFFLDSDAKGRFHIRLFSGEQIDNLVFDELENICSSFNPPPLESDKFYWVFIGLHNNPLIPGIKLFLPSISILAAESSPKQPRWWHVYYDRADLSQSDLQLSYTYYVNSESTDDDEEGGGGGNQPRPTLPIIPDLPTGLTKSVLTTSSGLSFDKLFPLLKQHEVDTVELFLLRNRDFIQWIDTASDDLFPLSFPLTPSLQGQHKKDIVRAWLDQGKLSASDMFTAMNKDGNDYLTNSYTEWIREILLRNQVRVSAFASYFSNIIKNTHNDELRKKNHQAICNCLDLAFRLKIGTNGSTIIPGPVIFEMVAGTSFQLKHKNELLESIKVDPLSIDNLVLSLKSLIDKIYNDLPDAKDQEWVLALEAEPGSHYVLNNNESLKKFFDLIESYPSLKEHIGLNYDCSHFKACGISARDRRFGSRLVNGHISLLRGSENCRLENCSLGRCGFDYNSSEHYRDLPLVVGKNKNGVKPMFPLERACVHAKIADYVQSCSNTTLPKSKGLSIEMEGAPNFSYIAETLRSLNPLAKPILDNVTVTSSNTITVEWTKVPDACS